MLEIFTAVALASSVVQFVDFGIKAVKTGREYYRSSSGTLQDLSHIERETANQSILLKRIRHDPSLSQDFELAQTVNQCSAVATELVDILSNLRRDPQKNRIMESASKSLKSLRLTSRIGKIEERLLKLRH